MKKHIPYYDPMKSYEDNYKNGPFGIFRESVPMPSLSEKYTFFDFPVDIPFGIPAGPLLNGAFMVSAWRSGFSINTYKTVRSRSFPCHQFPNIIAVHGKNMDIHPGDVVLGDTDISTIDITHDGITNSFGVPSQSPDIWINDMKETVLMTPSGSVCIASFMGTKEEHMTKEQYVRDFSKTCEYIKQTGARILEVNFSCPNIGKEGLICNDTQTSGDILEELHRAKGNNPLLVKIGYFSKEQQPDLEILLEHIHRFADGVVAINTIPATVIDENGDQVLPGSPVRRSSGTCGAAIR